MFRAGKRVKFGFTNLNVLCKQLPLNDYLHIQSMWVLD